jgi:hypothetical protein
MCTPLPPGPLRADGHCQSGAPAHTFNGRGDAGDPRQCVAHAARVLPSFPSHEAAAERLFSTLEWSVDPRRRGASHALLCNEMILRVWQISPRSRLASRTMVLSQRSPLETGRPGRGRRQVEHALRCVVNNVPEPIAKGGCFRVGSRLRSVNGLIPRGMPAVLDTGI